jgi:hypothetical protein
MARTQTFIDSELKQNDTARQDLELRRSYTAITESASRPTVTDALATAIQSSDCGFPRLIADLFQHCDDEQRANALMILVHSLTPASQQALHHAGLFEYVSSGPEAAVERVSRLCVEAVQLIAAEAERSDPTVVQRICDFYSRYPNITKHLPTPTLAVVLAELARRP